LASLVAAAALAAIAVALPTVIRGFKLAWTVLAIGVVLLNFVVQAIFTRR